VFKTLDMYPPKSHTTHTSV